MVIYFLIVLVGSVIAARLILGELRKERRDYVVIVPAHSEELPPKPQSSEAVAEPVIEPVISKPKELSYWEKIIAEKNTLIEELKRDVKFYRHQVQEFDKIKALMERQIFESRQASLATKRELDNLKAQGSKAQDEITRLKVEVNYKNHLLNQSDLRLSELKNRVTQAVPESPAVHAEHTPPKQELDLGDFSFDQLDWRKKLNE